MAFDVVVPVKPLDLAKSRLTGLPHDLPRDRLMRGFALDALSACLASPSVRDAYVVTDDPDLVAAAADVGAGHLPDLGGGSLNRALERAVQGLPKGAGVAALLGDLPCLRATDLTTALGVVATATRGVVVADAAGTGSTLLAVLDREEFEPHFGAGSFRSHLDAGYDGVDLPVPTLRRDVDTADDLTDAIRLGVGTHTATVLGTQQGR